MKRTGRERIRRDRNGGKPAKCVSCGEKGEYRVTFEDTWGKLTVTLCLECAAKKYEELKLQTTLEDYPIAPIG
jgi:hypothetical protein